MQTFEKCLIFTFLIFEKKGDFLREKMKGILLPRNYFKFPFVKVIVSKIAYKSLYNTKNEHFLTAHHQKVVRENFFRGFGDTLLIKNLFKPIKVINRTHALSTDLDTYRRKTIPLKKGGSRIHQSPSKKRHKCCLKLKGKKVFRTLVGQQVWTQCSIDI